MERNRFKRSVGDWNCSDEQCTYVNFARRTKCYRCQKQREGAGVIKKTGQEIGVYVASKSKGLFTAEDWHCSKCGNVNWARRIYCNRCYAPKIHVIEERHGYGGGYNDRETVEYIKRNDSDSEYDEFGRKKKTKKFEEKVKENTAEYSDITSDEDDSDMSKYDLSGWGQTSNEQSERDCNSRQANSELKADRSRSASRSRSPLANRK